MKTCYVLQAEESVTVYRSLKRLMENIGRPRQYQTFRRTFQNEDKITLGDVTILKGALITSTHN